MKISTDIEGDVELVPDQRYAVVIVEDDLAKLYVDTGDGLSQLLEIVTTWDGHESAYVLTMIPVDTNVEATRAI